MAMLRGVYQFWNLVFITSAFLRTKKMSINAAIRQGCPIPHIIFRTAKGRFCLELYASKHRKTHLENPNETIWLNTTKETLFCRAPLLNLSSFSSVTNATKPISPKHAPSPYWWKSHAAPHNCIATFQSGWGSAVGSTLLTPIDSHSELPIGESASVTFVDDVGPEVILKRPAFVPN